VIFWDDFESDRGWVAGLASDTATTGQWFRDNPMGTHSQPEYDHSTDIPGQSNSGRCFYTGDNARNQPGAGDVDQGQTTLVSPRIDCSGVHGAEAVVSYSRWYVNIMSGPEAMNDTFDAQVSNDDGATWVTAETVGPTGDDCRGGWISTTWRIADFVPPTAQVRVRFIAQDMGMQGIVEAAIDDFVVRGNARCIPPCVADFNRNGVASVQDVFDFLTGFDAGDPRTDVNQSGAVSVQDIYDFLAAWVRGCP
jgi:hypothetical protein